MGLWHGANWTFVFWGVYHATLVLVHRLIIPFSGKLSKNVLNIGGWMITMPLIMLSWIPFRAASMQVVTSMLMKLVQPSQYLYLGMRENIYIIAALLIILTIAAYLVDKYLLPLIYRNYTLRFSVETIAFAIIILVVIIFLRPISQFIYFQF
jgi:D-alanyl-lipoteichoic acid acyltransferase DltB (MBOAT superfamily)